MAKEGREVGNGARSSGFALPMYFRCEIDGIPKPQGRPRAFRVHDRVVLFDPETSRDWKRTVTFLVAQESRRVQWKPVGGPISISLSFYMPKPKSLPKSRSEWHTKRPDLDNLTKAVLDALRGVLYQDDSQIVRLHLHKAYATKPGVLIELDTME